MKIGIIGSGVVGQALGTGFVNLGHEVKLASRDPGRDSIKDWVSGAGCGASAGTHADVAVWCDLAVLATSWDGTENAVQLAGPSNLAGKVVVDVTNPLDFSSGGPALAVGHTDSGGETMQRWLAESKVVKAFNSIGSQHMVSPDFSDGPPDMFICGNDAVAKEVVSRICKDFGWGVVDLGGIEGSRYIEPLALIWITHLINTGSGDHVFKLLRK